MQIHTILARKKYARAVAAGCVAFAAGGIVLLRAAAVSQGATPAHGVRAPVASGPSATRVPFAGTGIHGHVALSQGRVLANGVRSVYAEVRVAPQQSGPAVATARPVALAVVLDVSGSMAGEKIEQARDSVLQLVNQMRDFDQIALVTYSDATHLVQPLARVSEVRDRLRMVIPTINVESGTNIPAGLALGAQALAETPAELVRRVVLISDGQDTSGRPLEETTAQVRQRADAGVTLSALGVGADYDERFMGGVADAGRGNYEFLRDGAQLRTFLARELQQAASTVVERAVVELRLPAGFRLNRAFGAEVQGTVGTVRVPVGALFAGDERRVVLDLAVDAAAPGPVGNVGVGVSYYAAAVGNVHLEPGTLTLYAAASEAEALASRDVTVYAEAESTALAARQQDAVAAWRDGRAQEAAALAQQNIATLRSLQAEAPMAAPALEAQSQQYARDQAAFGHMSAGSEAGRAYGLGSNAAHRRALRTSNAY